MPKMLEQTVAREKKIDEIVIDLIDGKDFKRKGISENSPVQYFSLHRTLSICAKNMLYPSIQVDILRGTKGAIERHKELLNKYIRIEACSVFYELYHQKLRSQYEKHSVA